MVSPILKVKSEKESEIDDNIKEIFRVIHKSQEEKKEPSREGIGTANIKVSELISKMSFFYEKIRNAVEYDEEHLLRKNAIERILRRQIMIEGFVKVKDSEKTSFHLLVELIRGGYLENDKIPESKIKEISNILGQYISLNEYGIFDIKEKRKSKNISKINKKNKDIKKYTEWVVSLAATDIELNLSKDITKQTIVSNIFDNLNGSINLPSDLPYQKDLKIQIILSIHRNFLKFDDNMLSLILFKYLNRNWREFKDEEIEDTAKNIDKLQERINRQLNHPLRKQIDKLVKKYSTFYSVLQETIEENPVKTYSDAKIGEKTFTNLIKKTCNNRYKRIRKKLWRSAFRSIVYIFLTKSIFVFLIEMPAIKWFGEELNYNSLAINIAFPAVLLFLMVLFTQIPAAKNTSTIVEGVKTIVYKNMKIKEFSLRRPIKRGFLIKSIFTLIYSATFLVSVFFIIKGLTLIYFNWVSIVIFLFFLTFVSFFSVRVKREIKEFIIVDRKESIFTFLFDFFYMPIVAVGKWMSEKIDKVNIFVFVLDFIIEAPFKIMVEIAEDWTKYVKERKEEIM